MMVKEERQRWLDAGITLGNDPKSIVKCPKCQQANLEVLDVRPESDPEWLDRYMSCPACGAWIVLSGSRPVESEKMT